MTASGSDRRSNKIGQVRLLPRNSQGASMPIYFSWLITALLSVSGDANNHNLQQSGHLYIAYIGDLAPIRQIALAGCRPPMLQ
jgi:hypothetical protein